MLLIWAWKFIYFHWVHFYKISYSVFPPFLVFLYSKMSVVSMYNKKQSIIKSEKKFTWKSYLMLLSSHFFILHVLKRGNLISHIHLSRIVYGL